MFYLIYLMPVAYPAAYTTAPPLKNFDASGYKVSANYVPWMYRESHRPAGCPPPPAPIAADKNRRIGELSLRGYTPPPGRFESYFSGRDYENGGYTWRRREEISKDVWLDAEGILIATAETEKDTFSAIRQFLYLNGIRLPYTNVSIIDYNHDGIVEKIKSVELYGSSIDLSMGDLQGQFPYQDAKRLAIQFYIHEGDNPPHYENPAKSTEPDKYTKAWFDYHEARSTPAKYEADRSDKLADGTKAGDN